MARSSWLFILAAIFTLNVAQAETIYTTVFNVFESKKTQRLLVLSGMDGRVYKMSNGEENQKKIKSLVGKVVRLDYRTSGQEAIITNVREAGRNEVDQRTLDLNHFRYNELRTFAPTDLQSYATVEKIFNNMLNDGDKTFSQCFKRAHMWSYDMWSKLGVYSEKIFIFYTKRFSILEEFDWWFHVAPMVTANGQEYVLDGTFFDKPQSIEDWKNAFLGTNKISCAFMNNIQEYESNQWSRLCYLMRTPMYHFSPLDIKHRDHQGIERNHWVLEELQDARKAFRNWSDVYEALDTGKFVRKF
jgi:hypothetical protein